MPVDKACIPTIRFVVKKTGNLVLVVIRLTCSRAIARDLRETRIYTVNTALENEDKNHPPTNTAYVLQYSDTRAR